MLAGERALLADALLGSLDDEATRAVETAWVSVAAARLEAYAQGQVTSLDGPTVLRELRGRYSQ